MAHGPSSKAPSKLSVSMERACFVSSARRRPRRRRSSETPPAAKEETRAATQAMAMTAARGTLLMPSPTFKVLAASSSPLAAC